MRRPILTTLATFCMIASTAIAQPGPERPASTESDTPIPEPAATQPLPEETGVINGPESDPVAREASSAALDSSVAKADTSGNVRNAADSSASDSARKAQARAAAEAASRRPPPEAHGFRPPPRSQVRDTTPVVAEDATPYEDERGEGHRLKSDPRASKLYRSPRKAFFYSLVLPGAGQAWCKAYVRAGLFLAAEVGLAYGWYDISIRQARDKSREASRFADRNWSASRYEETRKRLYEEAGTESVNRSIVGRAAPYRDRYCDAIYGYDENPLRNACLEAPDTNANYQAHIALLDDRGLDEASIGAMRESNIKDLAVFYDRIGRDDEFVPGWADATSSNVTFRTLREYDSAMTDNDPSTVPSGAPWGTSQMRAQYLAMRRDADDLASTQSWFIGGLVLNHLLSAVDAALTAQRMNRRLYKEERTAWVDGLHVQGGLAWANGPATRADMFLEF